MAVIIKMYFSLFKVHSFLQTGQPLTVHWPTQCIHVFHKILTINSIDRLVVLMETQCVPCEVRNSKEVQMNISLRWVSIAFLILQNMS
jgi:hypothetical protein